MPTLYGGGYYTVGAGGGGTGGIGPVGDQGPQGIAGVTGIQGPSGLQGSTGLQGPDGIQGITGIQGSTGLQGSTGIQGITGILGPTGFQGLSGLQGIQGLQGPAGLQGVGGSGQGSSTFAGLTDVNITGGLVGQTLYFNSGTNQSTFKYSKYPIWDVRDFGGAGDASTDNYAPFMRLKTALNASGGIAYIPSATGAYIINMTTVPVSGMSGLVYIGGFNAYNYFHITRDNVTIYCDPDVEIRTNVSGPNSGYVLAFFSMDNRINVSFINGNYTMVPTGIGLLSTIDDDTNVWHWMNGRVQRLNVINVNVSGWCHWGVFSNNQNNYIYDRWQIGDYFVHNSKFIDWGSAGSDNLLTCQGRAIFDSCHFIQNSGTNKKHSHVLYTGGDKPYNRMKKCTFKNVGKATGTSSTKYCMHLYGNTTYSYSKHFISADNSFERCRILTMDDTSENVIIKNNISIPNHISSADEGELFAELDRAKSVNVINNMAEKIHIRDNVCRTLVANNFGHLVVESQTSNIENISCGNFYNKLSWGGWGVTNGDRGLSSSNVIVEFPAIGNDGVEGTYGLIVNNLLVSHGTAISSAGISMTSATVGSGQVIHNNMFVWNDATPSSLESPRLINGGGVSTPRFFGLWFGTQFLSIHTSGTSSLSSTFYYDQHLDTSIYKSTHTFMREATLRNTSGINGGKFIGNNFGMTGAGVATPELYLYNVDSGVYS